MSTLIEKYKFCKYIFLNNGIKGQKLQEKKANLNFRKQELCKGVIVH